MARNIAIYVKTCSKAEKMYGHLEGDTVRWDSSTTVISRLSRDFGGGKSAGNGSSKQGWRTPPGVA